MNKYEYKLGTHRGNKRLWLNNRKLSATFDTDMVSVEFDVDNLIIKGEL